MLDWWDFLAFVVLLPFVEFLGGMLGYLLVLIVSFGQVRLPKAGDQVAFPWYGFARTSDGRLVVQDDTVSLIGAGVMLFFLFTYIAWRAGAFHA